MPPHSSIHPLYFTKLVDFISIPLYLGRIRSDEVGFLHPTQFGSLACGQDGDSSPQASEIQQRYFWCGEHKLAISAEILPQLYRAARDAYYNSRNGTSQAVHLMSHTKALLVLCPDMLTAWNSRFGFFFTFH